MRLGSGVPCGGVDGVKLRGAVWTGVRRGSNSRDCNGWWQGNMRGPRGQSAAEEDTLKHFEQIIIIVQKYGGRKNSVKT